MSVTLFFGKILIYLNKKALKYNTLNKGHICIFENLNISKESKGY